MEAKLIDVVLCTVPQWSPFQPPLSLPSLAAWIRRAGFGCSVHDENIEFYDYLLSEAASELLIANGATERGLDTAAVAGLRCWRDFRSDIDALRSWQSYSAESISASREEILRDTYRAINSLDAYLRFVSAVSQDFHISPYEFRPKKYSMNSRDVQDFVDNSPEVISNFVKQAASRLLACNPRVIGLSCIGQEQLFFTLLIGREIKRVTSIPVVVGGTVFSRIVERGVLPAHWLGRYIDIIVRNEGEKPLENLLRLSTFNECELAAVNGIVFQGNHAAIQTSPPVSPLKPSELPVPEFEGLPLDRYITSQITLPLLSSRGCYWGHCEFCHHGMVYGEKYTRYGVQDVIQTIKALRARHNVHHFAFNDEAIPPKMFRALGEELGQSGDQYFTALIKFEKYFTAEDFENTHSRGFRSLYVGLESASEHVLQLMRKNNTQDTMMSNLQDAARAGIWMHCFLFFGFPGERDEDAEETIEFMLNNSDVIGSFGAGTFSLEHNAPIMKNLEKHGLRLDGAQSGDLDVYYNYFLECGLAAKKALYYMEKMNAQGYQIEKYRVANWIPREHLLILLSIFSIDELLSSCAKIVETRDIGLYSKAGAEISLIVVDQENNVIRIINRLNRAVVEISGPTSELAQLYFFSERPTSEMCEHLPWLATSLSTVSDIRLSIHESEMVI
jgi:radical SAM superfamily enzyme YgiQ (UPF0313 family)